MSDNAPLLVDAAQAARLLAMGRTSFFGLVSAGRVPRAVLRHGRIVRWDRRELADWCAAGCPPRDAWDLERPRR